MLLYSGTHQGPNILQCPNTEIYSTFVYIPHPPFYFLEFSLLYISHEASPREERKGVTDYVLCTINNTNSSFLFLKKSYPYTVTLLHCGLVNQRNIFIFQSKLTVTRYDWFMLLFIEHLFLHTCYMIYTYVIWGLCTYQYHILLAPKAMEGGWNPPPPRYGFSYLQPKRFEIDLLP